MKKKMIGLALAILVVLAVVGCGTTSLVITVDPEPFEFFSGDDPIEGTITVTVTGIGSLTIDGVIVEIYRIADGVEEEIFVFDTGENEEFANEFPVTAPIVAGNPKKEFSIEHFLGEGYTINDLINEIPLQFDILTYEDLKGADYQLKITIEGSPTASKTVDVIFN